MIKRYQYAVRSKTATSINDKRCWMNIGTAKLERAAKSGDKYWFVCMIDGRTYVYSAPAAELQEAFEKCCVAIMGIRQDQPRYSFYLDYKTGKIFAAVSCSMHDVVYQLEPKDVAPDEVGGEDVGPEPRCTDSISINKYTIKTSHKYAVRSKVATSINDKRCWINIETAKLENAVKDGEKYWFICDIDGHMCVYSVPAAELQEAFEEYDVVVMRNKKGEPKYSFYLDYDRGCIFARASQNDRDVIIELTKENVRMQVDESDDVGKEPPYFEAQGINLIKYEELSSKGKEIYNIQKLCSLLAEYGFECQRLINDSEGPDIIAYRSEKNVKENSEIDANVFLIQVKGRMTIKKAYQDKKLHIAFPAEEGWYIFPHDHTISNVVPKEWLETKSWDEGFYHVKTLSDKLKKQMEKYLIKWPEGKRNQ